MNLPKTAAERYREAALLLVVTNSQYPAGHADRQRIVGNALQRYRYWWYRTIGCTPADSGRSALNTRCLWAEGELGWEFDDLLREANREALFPDRG